MKKILDLITEEMEQAFADAGYEKELARVTLSNRPDLCEYQCNGAMAGAKKYHKAPIMIAEEVVAKIPENGYISGAEAVKPGFINLKTNPAAVADYLNQMEADEKLGAEEVENPKTIVIDYGGPNVAKPLHVGHLRSAIIGESVKRITRFMGNKVIGDIHLGDWGYQMGLIITELKKRQPDLPYFDDNFTGEYPKEAPFTISDLEEIYPAASAYAKEHDDYREEALDATFQLQSGKRGYRAIWDHIMNVSVTDLKKNYANLNVEFDLWKGESDAQRYIPDMVERLKKEGYAHIDNGALVPRKFQARYQVQSIRARLALLEHRQSKSLGNLENVGWCKPGYDCLYNVYMMDETHTVLAVGAGAVTKLRGQNSGMIQRIYNYKYPYEYIRDFDTLLERKKRIPGFYAEYD